MLKHTPGDLADRDFTAGMPNGEWPAGITRNQGRGREGAPLAAGRLPRRQDRRVHGRFRSRRGSSPTGCASRPRRRCPRTRGPWCIPTADAAAGGPDGWRSWTATTWHGRRAPRAVPRTSPRRGSPDVAAEGFLGRMRTESVYPGHWEKRTRDGVLVPIDDCIRWYDHGRIKRSLGWMSPVQYRQSQGMAA